MTADEGDLWVIKTERGFDRKPSDRDYETYFKCIMACANGEGKLADEERAWVVGFCAAFGGSAELVEELKAYKADEDVLDILARRTPVSEAADDAGNWARTLVFEAIRAAYADGELSGGERNVIRRMADKLGLTPAEVNQLEDHYLQEQRLRVARLNLLFPNKRPHTS